jgi:hypothetical protein
LWLISETFAASKHGMLTEEEEGLGTIDLLTKKGCFIKKKNIVSV